MQNCFILFVSIFCIVCINLQAEIEQKPIPLGDFTSSPVVLEISDVPEGATVAYFVRHVDDRKLTAWEPVHPDLRQSATRMIYPATHGERYQFRSVISTKDEPGMITISDFEGAGDHLVIGFESTLQLFKSDYYIYTQGQAQGTRCLGIRVLNKEEVEATDDDVAGFFMNSRLPTVEWDPYRYLEMYVWSDFPEPFTLMMHGEKEPHLMPLKQFSQTGDQPKQWHYIQVDMDTVFPEVDERGYMRACVITHPIKGWNQGEQYEFRIDAIRLWKDSAFVETEIDSSVPSQPTGLTHTHKGLHIEWNWQPANDVESGVAGYSYSWSRSSRDEPADEVLVTEPKVSIPFQKPPVYSDYHFKVKAQNHAGEWSTIAHEKVNYNPQNY